MTDSIWIPIMAVNVISFSLTTLLQKVLLKGTQSKPISYAIVYQLLSGTLILLLGLVLGQITFLHIMKSWISILITVFLLAFGNLFIFKSLKTIEASKYTVVFSTRLFFTILASSFLLSELLSFKQLIGAVGIFIGVVIVSWKSRNITFGKGEFFALLAAICFGLNNTNAGYVLRSLDVYTYLSLALVVPALLLSIIYPKEIQYIPHFLEKKMFGKLFLLCVFNTLANIAFFTALKIHHYASQLTAVNLISIILTVILSIILLRERSNFYQKLIGTIVTFLGLLLLL